MSFIFGGITMEKATIGSFIAILRKANGMTQKELAEKLNVSDKTISRWERDECAPDLTLIPVIADLFHVTTDELLRGRKAPESAEPPKPDIKPARQLELLLKRNRTSFLTRCLIALGVAAAGFLAALICNFGICRANLGFYVGCVFFAGALLCLAIFAIRAFSAVNTGDFDEEKLALHRQSLVRILIWTAGGILVLFTGTLPFVTIVQDAYAFLSGESWFSQALAAMALVAGICVAGGWLVCTVLRGKGLLPCPETQKKRDRLKFRTLLVTISILLVILLVQNVVNNLIWSNHCLAGGVAFDNFQDFADYMGRKSEDVESCPVYAVTTEGDVLLPEEYWDTPEEEILGLFQQWNQEVQSFRIQKKGDNLTFTVYTHADIAQEQTIMDWINAGFLALYLLTAAGGLLFYFRKRKRL